jgi:hypothetical protein
MTIEKIERFIREHINHPHYIDVHMKGRTVEPVMFIAGADYEELKEKNFWRVVAASKAEQWGKTKDQKLVRIYSGNLFTRLSNNVASSLTNS